MRLRRNARQNSYGGSTDAHAACTVAHATSSCISASHLNSACSGTSCSHRRPGWNTPASSCDSLAKMAWASAVPQRSCRNSRNARALAPPTDRPEPAEPWEKEGCSLPWAKREARHAQCSASRRAVGVANMRLKRCAADACRPWGCAGPGGGAVALYLISPLAQQTAGPTRCATPNRSMAWSTAGVATPPVCQEGMQLATQRASMQPRQPIWR